MFYEKEIYNLPALFCSKLKQNDLAELVGWRFGRNQMTLRDNSPFLLFFKNDFCLSFWFHLQYDISMLCKRNKIHYFQSCTRDCTIGNFLSVMGIMNKEAMTIWLGCGGFSVCCLKLFLGPTLLFTRKEHHVVIKNNQNNGSLPNGFQ
jgi:hypothetical protein